MTDYFDLHKGDWDGIYAARKGTVRWRLNRRFRRAVFRRMEIAYESFLPGEGCTVLDVGCGTGVLGFQISSRGARRVLGIDRADEMVRCATDHARELGRSDVCEFVHGDFMTHDFGDETFTFTAALGVLDYTEDAPAFLERMWSLTRERMVVSLPHSVPPRSWLRRMWHGLHGSRLHYFDRTAVEALSARLGPARSTTRVLEGSDRTYVLICDRNREGPP